MKPLSTKKSTIFHLHKYAGILKEKAAVFKGKRNFQNFLQNERAIHLSYPPRHRNSAKAAQLSEAAYG